MRYLVACLLMLVALSAFGQDYDPSKLGSYEDQMRGWTPGPTDYGTRSPDTRQAPGYDPNAWHEREQRESQERQRSWSSPVPAQPDSNLPFNVFTPDGKMQTCQRSYGSVICH